MSSLKVDLTTSFRKDLKRVKKRGKDIKKLKEAVLKLATGKKLPQAMRDHDLTGSYKGFRECHIEPDWLLIYAVNDGKLILTLTRTGSHSDLF